jgi:serine/threonine protein kinase
MSRCVRGNSSNEYKMHETHKLPCAWYPPESIREKLFSIKSDVWSFGVTVWEIFTHGEHPWAGLNANEVDYSFDFTIYYLIDYLFAWLSLWFVSDAKQNRRNGRTTAYTGQLLKELLCIDQTMLEEDAEREAVVRTAQASH